MGEERGVARGDVFGRFRFWDSFINFFIEELLGVFLSATLSPSTWTFYPFFTQLSVNCSLTTSLELGQELLHCSGSFNSV